MSISYDIQTINFDCSGRFYYFNQTDIPTEIEMSINNLCSQSTSFLTENTSDQTNKKAHAPNETIVHAPQKKKHRYVLVKSGTEEEAVEWMEQQEDFAFLNSSDSDESHVDYYRCGLLKRQFYLECPVRA